MSRFVDSIITYRILKLLVTPFNKTDAYKQGIIDANGKVLKKDRELNTVAERDAYTLLHRLVFRLKRIIEKVPIENKKLASYAAALALIKEQVELNNEPINIEEQYLKKTNTDLTEEIEYLNTLLNERRILNFKQFMEEAPANSAAASPGVDGFTPDTVGVPVKAQKKIQKQNRILRRSNGSPYTKIT